MNKEKSSKKKIKESGEKHEAKMKNKKFVAGVSLIAALLVSCIWLLIYTNANFKTPHYLFFYSCVSLISGLGFFILSESTGSYSSKSLGIRLTGGAGIGAALIFLFHSLLPLNNSSNLASFSFEEFHSIKFDLSGEALNQLSCTDDRYILEFLDDSESVEINAEAISKKDGLIKGVSVTLYRNGSYELN